MKGNVLRFLLLILFMTDVYSSIEQKRILHAVQSGVEKLIVDKNATISLLEALNNISKIKDPDNTICKSCKIVMDYIIYYRRTGADRKSMISYLHQICETFSRWGTVACKQYVDIEIDKILLIIDNKRNLTSDRICAIHFHHHKCVDRGAKEWYIHIPPMPKPHENGTKKKDKTAGVINVLQLTDIHYDTKYQSQSDPMCQELVCCQDSIPVPEDEPWGNYPVCYIPQYSVHRLLQHIKEEHVKSLDIVYYTGVMISHKLWSTSKLEGIDIQKEMYELFSQTFTNKDLYPLFSKYPAHFNSSNAAYENKLSDEWLEFLPKRAQATIRKLGYYSILARPGFRIIGLNDYVCSTSNLWLIYDEEVCHQQLIWLVQELYAAEMRNEKVHILSHLQPGEIFYHKEWNKHFDKVRKRFSAVISAQFSGYTHVNEFGMIYEQNGSYGVTNVAFNGAGFTTYVGFIPNYRIYEINSANGMVQDYDQYTYHSENAKVPSEPEWYKISFKEDSDLEWFGV